MDVERTMQFILETQAKTEAILQELGEKQKATEAWVARAEAQRAKDMKEIREILKLGLKRLAELSTAQKKTEKSLAAFIDSMNRGTNGRSSRR